MQLNFIDLIQKWATFFLTRVILSRGLGLLVAAKTVVRGLYKHLGKFAQCFSWDYISIR